MTSELDKVPAPPSGWLRAVLVISLTLNLLLVGLAVGTAYKFKSAGGPPRNYDLSLGPLGASLDQDARRELGRSLSRMEGARLPRREERGRAVSELAGVLVEEPFDPDALAAMLSRQRQQWSGVQDSAQAAMVAYIAALTPEARADLADRLLQQAGPRRSDDNRGDDRRD
ncbi:periplasmic heavy metal sensor [Flavimaricola marinus]|uniref:Periplasmic heavy metal sensor n=1 Tax=Flavimaricola marinus TaxID=1819565 RepID=A0A238LGT1_9RHOB|nr:periplasmic heavy metal sensor [Flavimaricola marinus]SMY08753.1 hypothetical protein LOM8899_02909 [Flavimaricola marinus]